MRLHVSRSNKFSSFYTLGFFCAQYQGGAHLDAFRTEALESTLRGLFH